MARTTKPKMQQQSKPSGPFGGWMKNPPSECEYKRKDSNGIWVETVMCAFKCIDIHCECYVELMKDSKSRIKGGV